MVILSGLGIGLIVFQIRVNEDVRIVITKNKINRKYNNKDLSNYFVVFLEITNLTTYSQFYDIKLSDYIIKEIHTLLKKRLSNVFLYSIDQLVIINEFDNKTVINQRLRNDEQMEKTNKIVKLINQQLFRYENSDESYQVSVRAGTGSVGIREEFESINELIKLAHFAMLKAKKDQREIVIATEVTRIIKDDVEIFNQELATGMNYDEFEPFFLPIIEPNTMKIIGAESLLRWVKNDYRIIEASKFKDIAIEKNLFHLIDKTIIDKSFHSYHEWIKKEIITDDFTLTINLSLQTLLNINPYELEIRAKEYQIRVGCIEFDISESDIANTDALHAISNLKAIGFKVSLDAFHTKNTILKSLFNIQVDTLKVDKIHMPETEPNGNEYKFYSKLVTFSNMMGYNVMSKGIENKEQLRLAKKLKVNYVQGYYFTPPLNDTQILGYLTKYQNGILV